MRKFAGLRTGKYIAQGAHASMGALLKLANLEDNRLVMPLDNEYVRQWLTGRFKKITVYVNTEQELLDVYAKAQEANIPSALVRDAGLTEFNGVPTLTSVGIGPWDPEEIDKITGKLPLF